MASVTSVSEALQVAVYQHLKNSLTCPVYDAVPKDAVFPYVTLDRQLSNNETPIQGKRRDRRYFYFAVWSKYQGQMEVKRIMAEIEAALDRRKLTLTVGRVVSIEITRSTSDRDADGKTYQGNVTAEILTQN